jgi:serine protease Do
MSIATAFDPGAFDPGFSLSQLTADLTTVAETLRRSTVQVRGQRTGTGSGVIWSQDGVIVTNAHVVTGTQAEVECWDGRVFQAGVSARNLQRDLVALKVEATELPAALIGDSTVLRVGELVLAIGNPSGTAGVLTSGIVHALGSPQISQPQWIQADVSLAPGNSGGPLANAQGQVIGINTMIVQGRGFAIPAQVVQRFLSDRRDRLYLGVSLQPIQVRTGWRSRRPTPAFLITAIEPDSPAELAQLQPGDVLLGVRSRPFQDYDQLSQILELSNNGDGLPLDVLRGEQRFVADVVLWSRTTQAEAA